MTNLSLFLDQDQGVTEDDGGLLAVSLDPAPDKTSEAQLLRQAKGLLEANRAKYSFGTDNDEAGDAVSMIIIGLKAISLLRYYQFQRSRYFRSSWIFHQLQGSFDSNIWSNALKLAPIGGKTVENQFQLERKSQLIWNWKMRDNQPLLL